MQILHLRQMLVINGGVAHVAWQISNTFEIKQRQLRYFILAPSLTSGD